MTEKEVADIENEQLADLIQIAYDLYERGRWLSIEQINTFLDLVKRRMSFAHFAGIIKMSEDIFKNSNGLTPSQAMTKAIAFCYEQGFIVIATKESVNWRIK